MQRTVRGRQRQEASGTRNDSQNARRPVIRFWRDVVVVLVERLRPTRPPPPAWLIAAWVACPSRAGQGRSTMFTTFRPPIYAGRQWLLGRGGDDAKIFGWAEAVRGPRGDIRL